MTRQITRQQIVECARLLVKNRVKYAEQGRMSFDGLGRLQGPGTDCCGVLLFVGQQLKITTLEVLGYSNEPRPDDPPDKNFGLLLEKHCVRLADPRDAKAGDIFAHDFGKGVQHASIVVGCERLHWRAIHAKRTHGVHEAYLTFQDARAIVAAYSLPNVLD